ncbi:MAG TPA: hypothetical protein EYP57_02255 [Thermodesulfobacteriaceae bacterium]|nr:hypothetical protein [Thermodesulfobacteriaceae bacterium]
MKLPDTHGSWARISRTFLADEQDSSFRLMVVTDGPAFFLVDDIKLEHGQKPTIFLDPDLTKQNTGVQILVPRLSPDGNTVQIPIFLHRKPNFPLSNTNIRLVDKEGSRVVFESSTVGNLLPGLSLIQLSCPISALPSKQLNVEVTVASLTSKRSFSPLPFKQFSDALYNAGTALEALEKRLNPLRGMQPVDVDVAYAMAASSITKRFIKTALKKAALNLVAEATDDLNFLARLCNLQDSGLARSGHARKSKGVVPEYDLYRLRLHSGNFYAGAEPVLLAGAMGYGELFSALGDYRNAGFNSIGDDFDYFSKLWSVVREDGSIDGNALARLEQNWRRLSDMNIAIAFNPAIHTKLPEWVVRKYPDAVGGKTYASAWLYDRLYLRGRRKGGKYGRFFEFDINSPHIRQIISGYYKRIIPIIQSVPVFHVVWLMNEPTFYSTDAGYMRLFQKYLKGKYRSIKELNDTWQSSYPAFGAITGPPDRKSPGWYDWLTFHQGQVSSWYDWLASQIRHVNKSVLLSNKPHAGNLFRPESGIDFEHEADLWDVVGFDAVRKPVSERYAFEWSQPTMMLDFFRSVAPDKPAADFEFHYVHQPHASPEYVRAAYLHSYLHGLRMSQFWIWATGAFGLDYSSPGLAFTAWSQPKVAWGTVTSAIDLRRLAKYISAFPGKAEVMIYYSRPSLFLNTRRYKNITNKTYEALNSLGASIGFITDRMIRRGQLKDCKLLVIPGAKYVERDVRESIREYLDGGGYVIVAGDECLSRDQYKRKYGGSILRGREQCGKTGCLFMVRPNELLIQETLRQIDRLYDRAGVTRLVKIYDRNGNIPWPLEYRSVEFDGKVLCYVIGLGKEPVGVRIICGDKSITNYYCTDRSGLKCVKPLVFCLFEAK